MYQGASTTHSSHREGSIVGKPVVAAVFATMNRKEVAVSCVRALAVQTSPPEFVFVADNVSSDGTPEWLEELADLPFELVVHRMRENRGNAGGVEEVMELAFAQGADAVWILDDDSWPRPNALEALLAKTWDPRVVRHPLQMDPRTKRFTWPLQVADGSGGWRLANTPEELPSGDFIRSRITWTGALLPREVRELTGPVNGELFIRGEDEEYPWRFEQAGFSQEAARHAILDHPGPENLVHWKFLGKHFFFERGLSDWKLYYKVRNMVWLKREQSGWLASVRMAIVYVLASVVLDGPGKTPLLCHAILDGWNGRLGKLTGWGSP
jgi:rhamnopyranosyl-N-acetylglucosaminyl-diphospho-decaprenol beta-1,3/1,4-galactofuranosyltransferase